MEHKYYQAAYRAHSGTSFSPDRRAKSECDYYDEICTEFTDAGKEWAIDKFTGLFLKSLSAKARCVSTMIAGPANFPVARMEKYNRWERNATQAMIDFVDKVRRPPPQPRKELDYNIEAKEYEMGGATIRHNTEQNRLQIVFPGRPDAEMIGKLKSRGFKWSPRNQAWQRQLTPNAINVLRWLFPEETERRVI